METNLLIKVAVAIAVGALVGAEREYRSKSAGFRTMVLISVGATIFTYCSQLIGGPNSPDRIASNIATGIGFIGAGVIFKSEGRVSGLTSAATIWVVAAMGMLIAMDDYAEAFTICGSILAVQSLFVFVEKAIYRFNQIRTYKIVCKYEHETLKTYEKKFLEFGLSMNGGKQTKTKELIIGIWEVQGHSYNHERLVKHILKDPKVIDFEF